MCGGWSETKRVGGSERPSSRIGALLSLRRINRGGRPWSKCGLSEDLKRKKITILCILSSDITRPFLFSGARRLIVVKYNEVSWDFAYYRELWLFVRLEKHLLLPLRGFSGVIKEIKKKQRQRRSSERAKYFSSLVGTWHVCSIFQGWTREARPTASRCEDVPGKYISEIGSNLIHMGVEPFIRPMASP